VADMPDRFSCKNYRNYQFLRWSRRMMAQMHYMSRQGYIHSAHSFVTPHLNNLCYNNYMNPPTHRRE